MDCNKIDTLIVIMFLWMKRFNINILRLISFFFGNFRLIAIEQKALLRALFEKITPTNLHIIVIRHVFQLDSINHGLTNGSIFIFIGIEQIKLENLLRNPFAKNFDRSKSVLSETDLLWPHWTFQLFHCFIGRARLSVIGNSFMLMMIIQLFLFVFFFMCENSLMTGIDTVRTDKSNGHSNRAK